MNLPEYTLETQKRLISEYPQQPLKGQVALVTGGSSGIGEGCARHLAAAGAHVFVNYVVKPDIAEQIAKEIRESGGSASAIFADVSNEVQVLEMFERIIFEMGSLDILVANAGLQRDSAFTEMTVEQWDTVLNVNLKGVFLCARSAVREFKRRGVAPYSKSLGKIVCMSSVHQAIPWAKHVNYAASKGGVMLLMQSLAQEISSLGIRVNGIAPGAIATNINRPAWETKEAEEKLLELIPYNRVGVPDDIGRVAAWLCSDASDYVVGTTIFVDGAMTTFESFAEGG